MKYFATGIVSAYLTATIWGINARAAEPAGPHGHPIQNGKVIYIPVVKETLRVPSEDSGAALEESLRAGLRGDPNIGKVADVGSVTCQSHSCQVGFEPKSQGGAGLGAAVLQFLRTHPKYGRSAKPVSVEGARTILFTFVLD